MKAIALAVSARNRGNCRDSARFVLDRLAATGMETELINFYDYRITPCQQCSYQCLDDVRPIWEKTWSSEILFLFAPTYGGMPPALWLAFSQHCFVCSSQRSVDPPLHRSNQRYPAS